jgi:hypothetical protein
MNAVTALKSAKFRRCGVLSDDELHALREIERRLRWESPELARLFNSQEPQPAMHHRQRARTRMLLSAAALTGLILRGPRGLTEAEVQSQQRRPLPRIAPSGITIAEGADPLSGPATLTAPIEVADISVAPSTIVATPLCQAA